MLATSSATTANHELPQATGEPLPAYASYQSAFATSQRRYRELLANAARTNPTVGPALH